MSWRGLQCSSHHFILAWRLIYIHLFGQVIGTGELHNAMACTITEEDRLGILSIRLEAAPVAFPNNVGY